VTDYSHHVAEKKIESNLWQLREQLGGSLYLSISGGGGGGGEAGVDDNWVPHPGWPSHRLSQSLPGLNGSIPQPLDPRLGLSGNWLGGYHDKSKPSKSSYLTANFISTNVCPVLVSVLAISATLFVTLSILHWNYVENKQRKISKKMIILNHWGKQKPVESDLKKLYADEMPDENSRKLHGEKTSSESKELDGG